MKNLSFCIAFFAFLVAWKSSSVYAGTVMVGGASCGGFTVKVLSQKEARFKSTIHQQYDFSCGSAALSTLLTFHYNDSVSEKEIFQAMYATGDQEKIRKEGFSLLDIKKYLKTRGYNADGFRTTLDKLEKLAIPAIVMINNGGYQHFVIIKGITSTKVLLGDPSQGILSIPRSQFEQKWSGLLFLVRDGVQVARRHFNQDKEWKVYLDAPLYMALGNQELANITLLLPGQSEF